MLTNERFREGKNDADVKYITNIGHDIDAHDGGEEAKQQAQETAVNIALEYARKGKQPIIINSGHGYWAIHHIPPIENTEDNVKRIKKFGEIIGDKYAKEKISWDSTVYNPSRIIRLAGTLNLREKDNPILSSIDHIPDNEPDEELQKKILEIPLPNPTTTIVPIASQTPTLNSFMDYCITHKLPEGERNKVISRHIALYLSNHPNREFLKEQYCKMQGMSSVEIDGYLKRIDEEGRDKFPFSIGELVNFTRKYKIPFDWNVVPEYQQYKKEKQAEKNLQKEVEKAQRAELFGKAIKYFTDKKHLAEQFLDVQPLYYDKAKNWWIWSYQLCRWEVTDETDIMNFIPQHSEADTIKAIGEQGPSKITTQNVPGVGTAVLDNGQLHSIDRPPQRAPDRPQLVEVDVGRLPRQRQWLLPGQRFGPPVGKS